MTNSSPSAASPIVAEDSSLPTPRTKNSGSGPSRTFCMTINNYSEGELYALEHLDGVRRLVVGAELSPTTGTNHLQIYLRMIKPHRISAVRKWFPRAHIEIAQSTSSAANYCMKERVLVNIDNPGQPGKRTDMDTFAIACRTLTDRELYEEHPGAYLRFGQNAERIRTLYPSPLREPPTVLWFYGPTGTGKTRKVYDKYPDLYAVPPGDIKWFDGYHGQPVCLFDDLRDSDIKFSFLLRLLDRYPLFVPIKGGFTQWKPTTVVVTCPFRYTELFGDATGEDLEQLGRRITTTVHFGQSPQT